MGLTVDAPVPPEVLEDVRREIGATRLRAIELPT
jgi:hypothetical protein